jgi:hypothetical protein
MERLASLLSEFNRVANQITAITGRPTTLGHVGEFIASQVFAIRLQQSASGKGLDGHFTEGPLSGKSVNIKWYGKLEGLLDINPKAVPDFYLVMTGPRSAAVSSRGTARPWVIDQVFLFDADALVRELRARGLNPGIATSVRQELWRGAELYPNSNVSLYQLSERQRELLALFGSCSGSTRRAN